MGTTKAANTVANPANDPCVRDSALVGYVNGVAVRIPPFDPTCFPIPCQTPRWGASFEYDYVDASTRPPGLDGTPVASDVRVSELEIYPIDDGAPIPNPFSFQFETLRATASATCPAPAGSPPSLTATTLVAHASIPSVPITEPVSIPVPYLGTIHLNSIQSTPNEIVARALWWEIPGGGEQNDFIAGEARAGFNGNPCA
jgi:hypothetical protein